MHDGACWVTYCVRCRRVIQQCPCPGNEKPATGSVHDPKCPGKRQKFNAQPVEKDGIAFASKVEGERYLVLKGRQERGIICKLECHPRWHLWVNGVKVTTYTADFRYHDCAQDQDMVEDVKGKATKTEAYGIRKRLLLAVEGISIREVYTAGA